MRDSGFDSQQGTWKFYGNLFLLPAFSSLVLYSAQQKCVLINILGSDVWPVLISDNSVILVVLNVKARI